MNLATNSATLTPNQARYAQLLRSRRHDVVVVSGPPGCGKTKLAIEVGMQMVFRDKWFKNVIITRPSGRTDNLLDKTVDRAIERLASRVAERLESEAGRSSTAAGLVTQTHFKSTLLPFIVDSIKEIDPHFRIDDNADLIEFVRMDDMRGRTLRNAWVLCDDMHGCTREELLALMTRVGIGSKLIIAGDPSRASEKHDSGFELLLCRLAEGGSAAPERIGQVQMSAEDIKRHDLIPDIIRLMHD